jgi:hypothetical protein
MFWMATPILFARVKVANLMQDFPSDQVASNGWMLDLCEQFKLDLFYILSVAKCLVVFSGKNYKRYSLFTSNLLILFLPDYSQTYAQIRAANSNCAMPIVGSRKSTCSLANISYSFIHRCHRLSKCEGNFYALLLTGSSTIYFSLFIFRLRNSRSYVIHLLKRSCKWTIANKSTLKRHQPSLSVDNDFSGCLVCGSSY